MTAAQYWSGHASGLELVIWWACIGAVLLASGWRWVSWRCSRRRRELAWTIAQAEHDMQLFVAQILLDMDEDDDHDMKVGV